MLNLFPEENFQKSILSLSEVHAKILVLAQEVGLDLEAIDHPLLPKQLDSSMNADLVFLYGKMLKELSPQTMAQTFSQLSKPLPTLGLIELNGNCVIQCGFYPKADPEYTLQDILEDEVDERYFLSQSQVESLTRGFQKSQILSNTPETPEETTEE